MTAKKTVFSWAGQGAVPAQIHTLHFSITHLWQFHGTAPALSELYFTSPLSLLLLSVYLWEKSLHPLEAKNRGYICTVKYRSIKYKILKCIIHLNWWPLSPHNKIIQLSPWAMWQLYIFNLYYIYNLLNAYNCIYLKDLITNVIINYIFI